MEMIKIIIYETSTKKRPFIKWLEGLDLHTQSIIAARMNRMRIGNFGDYYPLREGVCELRIHIGAGYRIYFGKKSSMIILILSGGIKKSQKKDIEKAIELWKSYKEQYG